MESRSLNVADIRAGLEEGAIIYHGKYRVGCTLGHGAMGVVLAAEHMILQEPVAIKVLKLEHACDPGIVERFLREARATRRIKSDHVVQVHDVDRLETGVPFIVMEYLEGQDLSSVRRCKKPLAVHQAAGYLLQACNAVADAHDRGIIHRDLKPANLFLHKRRGGQMRVKVLDFGISKISEEGGGAGEATKTNLVAGSARYMSPEQMRSTHHVAEGTDIWALGVILFELCTAKLLFTEDNVVDVGVAIATSPPSLRAVRLLREEVANAPTGLEAILDKCLQVDRTKRFENVREAHGCAQAPCCGRRSIVRGGRRRDGPVPEAGVHRSHGDSGPADNRACTAGG